MEAEEIDKEELSVTKDLLVEKMATLKELDNKLTELVPEEELEEEICRADEYTEKIHRTLTKINKVITESTIHPVANVTPVAPTRVIESTLVPPTSAPVDTPSILSDRVKLPKIDLPHFWGNLTKWTAFWDSFNSAVHLNDRLSDIDKFNYLRSLLEGAAADAIAGLALSTANYTEAIEILKRRFGNKQLINSKHMESLLNFSAVVSDQHLRDLRRLYDQSESSIRSLKGLGVEPESYGTMLSSVLLNKLPPDLRLIVSRRISSENLDLEILLETFEEELIAHERANNTSANPHRPSRTSTSSRVSTSAFSVTDGVFVFCQGSHLTTDCESVSSSASRKKVLQTSGCCYNCL
jgi:hypothetical protein